MRLDDLERDFQALVIDGVPGIERSVVGTARVSVATRLGIYADAYRARLTEALEHNYPKLAQLLGERQFGEMARLCIHRHPSTHYSLRWFGERLAEFLATTSPYRERAVVAELARWEWSMTLAFDAADASALPRSALAALPPEQWGGLGFTFHPSMQLLSLRSNAALVWRALSRDEPPPEGTEEAAPCDWLLWRRGLKTLYRSLDNAEARALRAARSGTSFAALCEILADELGTDNAALEAAKLLARWLDEELVVSMTGA